jgi:hypothetical protein
LVLGGLVLLRLDLELKVIRLHFFLILIRQEAVLGRYHRPMVDLVGQEGELRVLQQGVLVFRFKVLLVVLAQVRVVVVVAGQLLREQIRQEQLALRVEMG